MDNGAKTHQVELSDLEIIIVMFALALHKILFNSKFSEIEALFSSKMK